MGVQKLYEPSPTPILYAGLAADVLGRVPLMPLFLLGNSTQTIQYQLRQHRSARFLHRLADAGDESGWKGSNMYEINQWQWQFGPSKPRVGGLSAAETEEQRIAVAEDGAKRAVTTLARKRHKAPKAAGFPGGLESDIHRISLIQIFEI